MAGDDKPAGLEREPTEVIGPPRLLAGRYRLGRLIGEGGMGAVYAAEHTGLQATVAVKLLNETCVTDPDSIARFRREARAMGAVRHDNVVTVMDSGTDDDGVPFLVMELLEGESLRAVLQRDRVLSPVYAARIASQVLSGLMAAHDKDIIHRDLKPANVFMARQPDGSLRAKILDFGVSKLADSGATLNITADGVAVGTPSFMAPEQIRGRTDLDARVDVYAVGVLLYRMVTGRLPYKAKSAEALNRKILGGEAVPPRQLRPGIPMQLDEVIRMAMDPDRDRRYPDARSFREALRASMSSMLGGSLSGNLGAAVEAAVAASRPETYDTEAPTVAARPASLHAKEAVPEPRSRRRLLIAGLAVVILGLGGGGLALSGLFSSDGPHGPPLRFGINRFLPADELRVRFKGLEDYLTERLDRPVELVIAPDDSELIGMLDSGELDLAALSAYPYVKAKEKMPGLRILATPVNGGDPGYWGAILVRTRSKLHTLEDLRGHSFCYVTPGSTSGWLMPRRAMRRAGLDPDKDLPKVSYGNEHLETLRLLDKKACDAASVYTAIWHHAGDHHMNPEDFRSLADYFNPYDAYVVPSSVPDAEAARIKKALLDVVEGSDLAKRVLAGHSGYSGFIAGDDSAYNEIRTAVANEPDLQNESAEDAPKP